MAVKNILKRTVQKKLEHSICVWKSRRNGLVNMWPNSLKHTWNTHAQCGSFDLLYTTQFMQLKPIVQWRQISKEDMQECLLFGLSIERPILDHHPKAHIHEIRRISWNPADFTMKSGGFHEIREIRRISPVKSGGFHPWNPADFTREIRRISPVKSGGFHEIREIRRISWNPADFMKSVKSSGFHPWNPADFTQISPVKSTQNYKSKCFSKNSSVWWMQGGGYDQGFHEIHQISPWNLVDFTFEIQQSSPRFHLWNPPKIIKASVSAKTLQFDECKVGAMTKDFMKSAWNPADFTWNPPDFMKSVEIRRISCEIERPLARNCNPMFVLLLTRLSFWSDLR